jgi:hypothetical protein
MKAHYFNQSNDNDCALTPQQEAELREAIRECDEYPERMIPHEVAMQRLHSWLRDRRLK